MVYIIGGIIGLLVAILLDIKSSLEKGNRQREQLLQSRQVVDEPNYPD